jgi:hypothetical protein
MKTLLVRIIASLISFAIGIAAVIVVPHVYNRDSTKVSAPEIPGDDTLDLIGTAWSPQPILPDQLKRDSNDDNTWRWLKKEIARYQNSAEPRSEQLTMRFEDGQRYEIWLQELYFENVQGECDFLRTRGLQPNPDHRYASLFVHGINQEFFWGGTIDLSEPGLLYFKGYRW